MKKKQENTVLKGEIDMNINEYKYMKKYDKDNTVQIVMKLNKKTDADILKRLSDQIKRALSILYMLSALFI